jgi:hypothetical protein
LTALVWCGAGEGNFGLVWCCGKYPSEGFALARLAGAASPLGAGPR